MWALRVAAKAGEGFGAHVANCFFRTLHSLSSVPLWHVGRELSLVGNKLEGTIPTGINALVDLMCVHKANVAVQVVLPTTALGQSFVGPIHSLA